MKDLSRFRENLEDIVTRCTVRGYNFKSDFWIHKDRNLLKCLHSVENPIEDLNTAQTEN